MTKIGGNALKLLPVRGHPGCRLGRRTPPIGPLRTADAEFWLRPPRLSDGAGWTTARLADERHLAPALNENHEDWASANSLLVWTERWIALRRRAWIGRCDPYLVVRRASFGEHIVGEATIDGFDDETSCGEVSAWVSSVDTVAGLAEWATAHIVLKAFSDPHSLRWAVAPTALENPRVTGPLRRMGFEKQGLHRSERKYDGAFVDHDLWVLPNTAVTQANLRQVTARVQHNVATA